ncbi:MAG: FkbM family methyltransferase [Verrucomicrobiota bacterium]
MLRHATRDLINFYATKIPYHKGKWRVIEALLQVSGVEKLDRGKTFIVRRGGVRWKLNTACRMQRRLFYHGAFDNNDIRELTKRLGAGSVFFDVGSYFGYYSMVVSKETAGTASVYAFEPVSSNFELLTGNRDLNRCENVRLFQLAISDSIGEVSFEIPPEENGGTGRIATPGKASGSVETVATTTLDRFVEEHGIQRLDAMKIDVEGAEMRVFAGARRTLETFKPVLVVELNPPCLERFATTGDDLLREIRSLGYEIFRAKSTGLKKFDGLLPGESYTNLFCLPPGQSAR